MEKKGENVLEIKESEEMDVRYEKGNEVRNLEVFRKKQIEFEKSIQMNIEKVFKIVESNGSRLEIQIRKDQITKKIKSIKLDRDQFFGSDPENFVELVYLEELVDEAVVKIEVFLKSENTLDKNNLDLENLNRESVSDKISLDMEERMREKSKDLENENPVRTEGKMNKSIEYSTEKIEKQGMESKQEQIFCSLKKVNFPSFSGNINEYSNWANAFYTYIDKSSLSPEEKLLHLRQYLTGDAAKILEGIGYNAEAYELAKNRLGRRYGGERRKIGLFLEELEKYNCIRPDNALDLEKFSNFLDVMILNLKESNLKQELGSGLLYMKLQKKMNRNLVSAFHRWLHENKYEGNVVSLREFILLESEFSIIAQETNMGFSELDTTDKNIFMTCELEQEEAVDKNIFLSRRSEQRFPKLCYACQEDHEINECPQFSSWEMDDKIKLVMKYGLCFACFERGHTKKNCKHKISCQKCQKNHSTLFHLN